MSFKYRPRTSEALSSRENQRGSSFIGIIKPEYQQFSPKKENWLRFICPTWDDANHYGIDIYVHYEVGPNSATVLCPLKMDNLPCPECEKGAAQEANGEDSEHYPTKRVLVWVVDKKDEKATTPRAWAMPWTVDRDIAKLCRDRQTGELYYIDDPENGYNVSFDRSDPPNAKYTGVQLDRRPSPLDNTYLQYALDNPLPSILLRRSYDELKALHEGTAPEEKSKSEKESAPPLTTVATSVTALTTSAPVPMTSVDKFCDHGITVKGKKYLCKLPEGHTGDCDFDREEAVVPSVPPPAVEQPKPLIASRAAELRARLATK